MAETFLPKSGGATGASIAAATSSASTGVDGTCPQVRLYNSGSVIVYVRWGKSAQTATTSDMALAPGSVEVFSKQDADTIAAITSAGTATLYITSGHGL
jgi:hypothetical protein